MEQTNSELMKTIAAEAGKSFVISAVSTATAYLLLAAVSVAVVSIRDRIVKNH